MNKQDRPKVIVIGGPTASGKTGLSVELAKKINGEIISADSMQIYKQMDIGTAKVTEEEKQGIEHYMIDIISPEERYSVSDYKRDAECAIEKILSKNSTPIIVGGTGLYINSLIYNINYPEISFDEKYREQLESRALKEGLEYLYNEAYRIDKIATEQISKNDKKRIIRILEIYRETGKTKTELEIESRKEKPKYDYKVFGINMDRQILYDRIDTRVDIMFEQGLVEEVQKIYDSYKNFPTAMQGLGYKEVVEYLKGNFTYDQAKEKIKMESRRYAKRQITWFKAIKGITWLDGQKDKQNNIDIILEVCK